MDLHDLTTEYLSAQANSRATDGKAPRNRTQRKMAKLLDDLKKLGIKDVGPEKLG